jgi:hypothetical protein
MRKAGSDKTPPNPNDGCDQIRRELIEGYWVRRQEDAEINKAWEYATLEKWDESVDGYE